MSQCSNLTNCTLAHLFLLYNVISTINSNNNNNPSSVGTLEGTNDYEWLLIIWLGNVSEGNATHAHFSIQWKSFDYYCSEKAAQICNLPQASMCHFFLYCVTFKWSTCSDAPSLPTALPLHTNSWLLTFHLSPMGWPWRRTTLIVISKRDVHTLTYLFYNLCVSPSFACLNWNLPLVVAAFIVEGWPLHQVAVWYQCSLVVYIHLWLLSDSHQYNI